MSQSVGEDSYEGLSIRYAGPAMDGNSMDVRELAPSLLALADLFVTAHNQVGEAFEPPPALEVTAQRSGSFIVDLWLTAQETEGALTNLLGGPRATAGANSSALSAVVIGAVGWIIGRRRKGRESRVASIEPGQIRVTWPDGTQLETTIAAQSLVEHMDFHRAAARVFEPLRRDGVDEIEVRQRGRSRGSVAVVRDDLPAFNTLDNDETLLSDNTRQIVVRVELLAFKPGNKWRVNDGTASMWASVHDLAFLQKMGVGEERFADGDSFVVRMRDVQYQSPTTGIRVEHSIEEIIEHRSAPPPPDALPFDD